MFPNVGVWQLDTRAAPRTRGDVPRISQYPRPGGVCSPHPRGCSLHLSQITDPGFLLPAPAGMFPSKTPSVAANSTAPRTRGDVPGSRSTLSRMSGLLPAPAGMFPTSVLLALA